MSENQPILSEDEPTPPKPEDITRALAVDEEALAASRDRLLIARDVRIEKAGSNLSRVVDRLLRFSKGESAPSLSGEKALHDQDDQSSQNMS